MFERMRHDFSQVTTLKEIGPYRILESIFLYLLFDLALLYAISLCLETLDIAQTVIVFSSYPACLILKKIQLPKVMTPARACPLFVTPVMTTVVDSICMKIVFASIDTLVVLQPDFSVAWKNYLVHLVAPFCERGCLCLRAVLRTLFCQHRFTFEAKFKKWLYLSLFALPILYFAFAMFLLARYGEGAMVSRYNNLLLTGKMVS
ncbi:MAG: hypothetical protein ACLRX9_03165 [Streptococcus salivarius]